MLSMFVSILQILCWCHVDVETCVSTGWRECAVLPGEFYAPVADQDVLLQM